MNTALITACLAIMGKGMLGIFAVILVIWALVALGYPPAQCLCFFAAEPPPAGQLYCRTTAVTFPSTWAFRPSMGW